MPFALAATAALWTLGMVLVGVGDALAHLAPALLILLPLLGGRYPGDAALSAQPRGPSRGRRRWQRWLRHGAGRS